MANPRSDSCRSASPDLDCTPRFWFWTYTSQDISCWKTYPPLSRDISTAPSLHPTNRPTLQSTLQYLHTDTFTSSQSPRNTFLSVSANFLFFSDQTPLLFYVIFFWPKGILGAPQGTLCPNPCQGRSLLLHSLMLHTTATEEFWLKLLCILLTVPFCLLKWLILHPFSRQTLSKRSIFQVLLVIHSYRERAIYHISLKLSYFYLI